jgi:hypothetical protein
MKTQTRIKFKGLFLVVISILPVLMLNSCQKVINVDLNDAAPRIVIEGLINDRRGPYNVSISRSGSYFDQPVLPTVSGATVVITDNTGIIDTLIETFKGIYVTRKTRGFPGRTYALKVLADNNEFDGISSILNHVNIDSLTLVKSDIQRFDFGENDKNKVHYEIHCFFMDPPDKNYYRVRVFKNDSINTAAYRLYDDQYTNGQETELRVSNAEAGSTYRIELESLDKSTFSYYRTLADLIYANPIFGSTPANPNTNLSNGALGYFGAYAVASKTMVVTAAMVNTGK